ncbi:MBL fold metallo-hydrolase [Sphingomonas tabacisoli]|uniref:MBL fold metallo-hydrolase n=1 Tax=Sphingomonas tabacisoli TaxID=2249466 RepID=A0ABW4I0V6_9SPHN
MIPGLLALALAAAAQPVVAAPAPVASAQPLQVRQIRPDCYMITGAGGNVTVWVSDHGLIFVDDKLGGAANFDNLVAAARSISKLPVLAVFNTHHHADHIGNNQRFIDANVMVIGADGLARRLAAMRPPADGNPGPASPNLQFTQDFSLVMMRGRVEAHHLTPGHTDGDSVILFPAAGVIAMGDLLVAATPTFDYPGGANIRGWIAALDSALKLKWDLAVPGHGDAPMTRSDVEAFRAKLATFLDRARAAVRTGVPRDRLIASIRTDDLGWTWNERSWLPARLDGLWTEAGGA